MRVIFATNIDVYRTNCFPTNFTMPPRVGDKVWVVDAFVKYFQDKKLPPLLEITGVEWKEEHITCTLHYSEMQHRAMTQAGINPFP